MWERKPDAVKAVKFLRKRKHFEERSWQQKQTRKRLALYGAVSGSNRYSTVSTSLVVSLVTDWRSKDNKFNLFFR